MSIFASFSPGLGELVEEIPKDYNEDDSPTDSDYDDSDDETIPIQKKNEEEGVVVVDEGKKKEKYDENLIIYQIDELEDELEELEEISLKTIKTEYEKLNSLIKSNRENDNEYNEELLNKKTMKTLSELKKMLSNLIKEMNDSKKDYYKFSKKMKEKKKKLVKKRMELKMIKKTFKRRKKLNIDDLKGYSVDQGKEDLSDKVIEMIEDEETETLLKKFSLSKKFIIKHEKEKFEKKIPITIRIVNQNKKNYKNKKIVTNYKRPKRDQFYKLNHHYLRCKMFPCECNGEEYVFRQGEGRLNEDEDDFNRKIGKLITFTNMIISPYFVPIIGYTENKGRSVGDHKKSFDIIMKRMYNFRSYFTDLKKNQNQNKRFFEKILISRRILVIFLFLFKNGYCYCKGINADSFLLFKEIPDDDREGEGLKYEDDLVLNIGHSEFNSNNQISDDFNQLKEFLKELFNLDYQQDNDESLVECIQNLNSNNCSTNNEFINSLKNAKKYFDKRYIELKQRKNKYNTLIKNIKECQIKCHIIRNHSKNEQSNQNFIDSCKHIQQFLKNNSLDLLKLIYYHNNNNEVKDINRLLEDMMLSLFTPFYNQQQFLWNQKNIVLYFESVYQFLEFFCFYNILNNNTKQLGITSTPLRFIKNIKKFFKKNVKNKNDKGKDVLTFLNMIIGIINNTMINKRNNSDDIYNLFKSVVVLIDSKKNDEKDDDDDGFKDKMKIIGCKKKDDEIVFVNLSIFRIYSYSFYSNSSFYFIHKFNENKRIHFVLDNLKRFLKQEQEINKKEWIDDVKFIIKRIVNDLNVTSNLEQVEQEPIPTYLNDLIQFSTEI